MRSKFLILIALLLIVSMGSQAFGATMTVIPDQLPKGAYVNGPGGDADDNYYWQTLEITFGGATAAGQITIDLPDGVYVATTDVDADYQEEVALQENSAAASFSVAAGTTQNAIVITQVLGAVLNEKLFVMFPVTTDPDPTVTVDDYDFTHSVTGGENIAHGDAGAPEVTFRDPGALMTITFQSILTGNDDTTTDYGEMYPIDDPLIPLFSALEDLLQDYGAAATNGDDNLVFTADGTDTDDVTYTIWAATDSTLSHVDEITSGVMHVVDYDLGGVYELNEDETGVTGRISTAGLAEDTYYFFITSDYTGDFPLVRSGALQVKHYPQVKILGWDYDRDDLSTTGVGFDDELAGGYSDDLDISLDTGSYYQYDGSFDPTQGPASDVDIYISVDDFDDDAEVVLFRSDDDSIESDAIELTDLLVTGLTGATLLQGNLSENDEDDDGFIVVNWGDLDTAPIIPADTYSLYVVANDGKHQHLIHAMGHGTDPDTDKQYVEIYHSPSLILDTLDEYDSDGGSVGIQIDTSVNTSIMIGWGEDNGVDGDNDIDDECIINLYIDADDAVLDVADFSANGAGALESAALNPALDTHKITVSDLLEQPEGKSQSWYEWDFIWDSANSSDSWAPTAATDYHIYAVIDENKTPGTQRVVALGDGGAVLVAGTTNLTEIEFEDAASVEQLPYARIYEPPAKGVTIYGDDAYRVTFTAFDYNQDGDVGIFLVGATANVNVQGVGAQTITGANVTADGAGKVWCLTSTTGAIAAPSWLSEDDDSYYDILLRLPSDATPVATRYQVDATGGGNPLTDGDYFVYVCVDDGDANFNEADDILYRSPGIVTIEGIDEEAGQNNVMLSPSKFYTSAGDITEIEIRAADEDLAGNVIDIIDVYIALEKTYFDPIQPLGPFSAPPGVTTATLIANRVIDDTVGNRWILNATVFKDGGIVLVDDDTGSLITTFQVTCKGTNNADSAPSAIYLVNEPANSWVTTYKSDGVSRTFAGLSSNAIVQPRGIVEGIITFEGRDTSDNQVTFELRKTGTYVPEYDQYLYAVDEDAGTTGLQITLDDAGKFSLFNVPTGVWDLVVKYDRYLANKQEVTINSGLDTLFVNFGELAGGDCIGWEDADGAMFPDNVIDAADITRINDAYLDTPDSTRWETDIDPNTGGLYNYKWADINEDDIVWIEDLTMATGNYTGTDNEGAQPFYKPAVQPSVSNLDALVEFMALPQELTAGETYTFQAVIQNASNVKGYFVNFEYDKDALDFEGIVKGDFMNNNSYSFPTVGEGEVALSNAVFGPSSFSGDGVLAEITFTARRDGAFASTMLTIDQAVIVNSTYMAENIVAGQPTDVSNNVMPGVFELSENYPNPFNPTTTISFSIPSRENVTLEVYDILGRHVRTLASGYYDSGNYSVVWSATDMMGNAVSAGVYFYTINAGNYHVTKRMLLLK